MDEAHELGAILTTCAKNVKGRGHVDFIPYPLSLILKKLVDKGGR